MSTRPQLITGKLLSETIYDTIFDARKYLLILSPFIQLDEYFKKEVFERHKANANVHIIIVFGKNEDQVHRSFKREDIEYFKAFPNISIVYIPELHAKYYGNERQSVVSSMNLIDYSFKNNVELGVTTKRSIMRGALFKQSQALCFHIAEQEGYTLFVRRPHYKKKFFIKHYIGSLTKYDQIDDLIAGKTIEKMPISTFIDTTSIEHTKNAQRKRRDELLTDTDGKAKYNDEEGHCIRCRTSLSLNINAPYCVSCYKKWVVQKNPNYREKYCHSCGNKKESISYATPACPSCYHVLVKQGKGRRYSSF